ncbi:MAG: D-ribose pyranase [Candidatus Baldrarchaeia archaeon]
MNYGKSRILHPELSKVIASLGHKDVVVICDAGFPVPKEAKRIDLILTKNIPRFLDTLKLILEELEVESAIIAKEMREVSPETYEKTKELLKNIPIKEVSHEKLKEISKQAKAIIKTGEFTPYANIILICGVVF